MKKIYMFCAAALAAGSMIGQNASPNFESFELPTLPECWSTLDADGDGNNWSNFYQIDDGAGGVIPGNSGVGAMSSDSFINGVGALTPDNYLILPQLEVQEGEYLEWKAAGLDAAYSAEKYAIVVSTTGTAAADFTDNIFEETLSSANYESAFVSLNDYVGQQIYVAFRHYDVTDQFVLRIDDVRYPTTVADCAIVVGIEEESVSNDFKVFPNPSTGLVNIQLGNTQDQLVEVFNLSGQKVFSNNFQANSGIISLDLSDLSKGIYTVNLTSEGAVATEKLVIK
ncbi:MAG: choice-of-anchor J domain-containing protein [Flavobacteriales bacterium]